MILEGWTKIKAVETCKGQCLSNCKYNAGICIYIYTYTKCVYTIDVDHTPLSICGPSNMSFKRCSAWVHSSVALEICFKFYWFISGFLNLETKKDVKRSIRNLGWKTTDHLDFFFTRANRVIYSWRSLLHRIWVGPLIEIAAILRVLRHKLFKCDDHLESKRKPHNSRKTCNPEFSLGLIHNPRHCYACTVCHRIHYHLQWRGLHPEWNPNRHRQKFQCWK